MGDEIELETCLGCELDKQKHERECQACGRPVEYGRIYNEQREDDKTDPSVRFGYK